MEVHDMELCGYKEAAVFLGVPIGTLCAWVNQKRVPHIRLGRRAVRFDLERLRSWIASKRISVSPAGVQ
jgi:excisionase family DNA binding protein